MPLRDDGRALLRELLEVKGKRVPADLVRRLLDWLRQVAPSLLAGRQVLGQPEAPPRTEVWPDRPAVRESDSRFRRRSL